MPSPRRALPTGYACLPPASGMGDVGRVTLSIGIGVDGGWEVGGEHLYRSRLYVSTESAMKSSSSVKGEGSGMYRDGMRSADCDVDGVVEVVSVGLRAPSAATKR